MSNEKDRIQSRSILASKVGCLAEILKQKVFEKFDSLNVPVEEFERMRIKHESTKQDHALQYNMHPDDTPAGIMVEMIQEYILILQSRKKSNDQIFRELATDNTDLLAQAISAMQSGDMNRFNELIAQHPEFLDSFMRKMAENEGKND